MIKDMAYFKKSSFYQYMIPYISIKKYLMNVLYQSESDFCIFRLPDELLYDIPEAKQYLYSLFQGFLVAFDEKNNLAEYEIDQSENHGSTIKNELENLTEQKEKNLTLTELKKKKDNILNNINIINIKKALMSSKIKEIDEKISILNKTKYDLLNKLQKLRRKEAETINTLWDTETKIMDLIELKTSRTIENMNDTEIPETDDLNNSEFMSKSIYDKLNSPKIDSKAIQKDSMCILHEQFKPGSNIKSWKSHTETITAIDFDTPFGMMVTASLDDTVKIWNLLNGEYQGLLEGHNASVKCLQLENNIVATGSMDASIKLWNLQHIESYQAVQSFETFNYLNAKKEENNIHLLPFDTKKVTNDLNIATLESHMDEITALHFIGNVLVSGSSDKTLKQWDLETGKCVQTLDILWATAQCNNYLSSSLDNFKSKLSFKEKGYDFVGAIQCFDAALASGTADGIVRLWDLRSGLIIKTLFGHTAPITCLQFDKHHLITGSIDRSIRIWDLRIGSLYDAFAYNDSVTSLHFDSRRIVVSANEPIIRIYDRIERKHWNCGMLTGSNEPGNIVKRVCHKEGYLISGRQNGTIDIYTC
ncbi:hypothetical protein PNEG_00771 [Pneumocystis murina B123]|uniref:Uncharacterized protein n=1 Tax=Pneumocystis murina (strain B123) TaxID=1069680 RepID=M7NR30_PNEMU|nr:hypothetical protein PNEG_00771 [Pneumocystis murina B123]EMR11178.1 hypothetical protein PNEG_00771 [Pneumocystis murina B123]